MKAISYSIKVFKKEATAYFDWIQSTFLELNGEHYMYY